jgi:hypothetical protein
MLLLQDGTYGERLPTRTGEIIKVDPARFAYTTIKALTKKQRESFTKMAIEDKDEEDF